MAKEREIAEKFWKALRSDRTLMLGLAGVQEGHSQPMTAQLADDRDGGPIWFFTSSDTDLAKALGKPHRAVAHFAAKGHDLFASIHGELVMDNDRTMIDRLWNRFVAAWFEGGQEDPKVRLLRLDAERAQIWLNENNLARRRKAVARARPEEGIQGQDRRGRAARIGQRPPVLTRTPGKPASATGRGTLLSTRPVYQRNAQGARLIGV